jgi:hypothetical protein
MPYLYLFTLQNLTCYSNERHYAIISKQKQVKLEKLKEGEITGCFNEFGLQKDLITNYKIISILDNIFNEIISNYKDNIKIIKNNENYLCLIDDKKIEIKKLNSKDGEITYNNVGIYV